MSIKFTLKLDTIIGKRGLATIVSLFMVFLVSAQDQKQDEQQGNFYVNASLGFGMLYGGFGANIEAGYGHFALYSALGYATQRTIDTIVIAPSVNYQFGLRYYFNVGSESVFPRIGIGYGWIANYASTVGHQSQYNQHAQGVSIHLGTQIFSSEGLVFSFDLGLASRYTLIRPNDHSGFSMFMQGPTLELATI